MWKEITDGFYAYLTALSYIQKHGLWKFLLISGVISFLVCMLIFSTAYFSSDNIAEKLISLYPFEWGSSFLESAGSWIVFVLLMVGSLFIIKYVIIIALGPLLSLLSEKIESIEHPEIKSPSFSLSNLLGGVWRGIRINVRNIFMELLYTLLLLLAGIIPVLSFISGPSIILLQSYYAGSGNFDLYLERHLNYRESLQFMRKRRPSAIANGIVFIGIITIPVLGWIFAPFLSVVAASLVLSKDAELSALNNK